MKTEITQKLYETLKSAKESYDMTMYDLPFNDIAKGAIRGAFITLDWSVIDEYEKAQIDYNICGWQTVLDNLKFEAQVNVKIAEEKNPTEAQDNYMRQQYIERMPKIIENIRKISKFGYNETFCFPDLNIYEKEALEAAGFTVTIWEYEMEPNKCKISWEN